MGVAVTNRPHPRKTHPGKTHREKRGHRRIVSTARAWRVALLAGATLALPVGDFAEPQSSGQPTISIAALSAEPAAQVPFRIRIGPEEAIPTSSFVRVKGLPSMAALSDGHSIAPGSWAIPLGALTGLKLTLPEKTAGRFDVIVTLVGTDGSVIDEARTTLVVQGQGVTTVSPVPKAAPPPAAPAVAALSNPPRSPSPGERAEGGGRTSTTVALAPSGKERERAVKLFREGNGHVAQGNISAARLVYELAAEAGLGSAAMALAGTYDAAELMRLNVRGIQADAREAKRWYERARELGETEAEQRLRLLGSK
jgi:hypothetical protein